MARASAPPGPPKIPDKAYFKIGEAAKLVGVEPHVLRFWEAEFPREVRPERTASNQRVYRRRDVEAFLRIKQLRHEEGLAIPGAKRKLRVEAGEALPVEVERLAALLTDQLRELIRIVDEDESGE